MSSQPLYRIVYADGTRGMALRAWPELLIQVRWLLDCAALLGKSHLRPVAVEVAGVSPAPRATGGER